VRIRAGNELPRHHETLLGKVEVENAVARRRVIRLHQPVYTREFPADARLLVVVGLAREDEVIVGDCSLARIDRAAARDLVERMNRERRRAIGRRQ
jgi:hypothetical protein